MKDAVGRDELEQQTPEVDRDVKDIIDRRVSSGVILGEGQVQTARLAHQIPPVEMLLDEIILDIADYFQFPPHAETDVEHEDSLKGARRLGLVMSRVTRRWRYLILDSPTLWSHIQLYHRQSREFIETSLARSRDCPLDIALIHLGHNAMGLSLQTSIQLERIRSSTHRWRSLTVDTNGRIDDPRSTEYWVGRLLEPLRQSDFPMLQYLWLDHCNPPWKGLLSSTISPSLKNAAFLNCPFMLETPVL